MIRPLAVAGFSALAALLLTLCILPSAATVPLAVLLLVVAAAAGGVTLLRSRRGKHTPGLWLAALAAALALLRLLAAQTNVERLLALDDSRPHTLQGAVLATGSGLYEGVYALELRVTQLDGAPCRPFRVRCSNVEQGSVGDELCITAELQSFSGSYRQFQYGKGVFLRAMQLQPGTEQLLGQSGDLTAQLARLRLALGQTFLPLGRSLGGVAAAMVVGESAYLAESTSQQYRQAGITHLLVVSGMHVSLLCGVLLSCLNWLFPRKNSLNTAAAAVCLIAYMALMGFSASVVRAGLFCLLMLLGRLLRQPTDDLTTMGIALLLLLAVNPYASCDVGLLLSFASTMGVLCFGALDREHFKLGRFGFVGKLAAALGTTALATLFTLPVLAASGTTLSPATLLCNVLCLPVVLPIMAVGTVYLVTHLLTGTGALLLSGRVLQLLLALLEWVAVLANRVFSARYGVSGPMAVLMLCLAVLVTYLLYYSGARRFAWLAGAGTLLTLWALCIGLTAGTVRVALVGTGINPAVVISRDSRCAVVLRGDDRALADVQEYMANQGLAAPELVVDLADRDRTNVAHSIGAADLVVPHLTYTQTLTCLDGIRLTAIRQDSGSLCYITVDGCSMGLCNGPVQLEGYPACTVWLAGNSRPDGLAASLVLRGEKVPAWQGELASGIPVYTGTTPTLWLRGGKTVRLLQASLDPDQP